ncbi:MAG TPA: hypothetical protein DCM62_00140 [Bacteroidales bacterium]|nr:hypothetical protein [Bacteroidales bacterium]
MTHLVHLLMALIVIHFVFRQSMQRLGVNLACAVIAGLSLVLLQPAITAQSKTQLEGFLTNPEVLSTLTILVILECVLVAAWCFAKQSKSGKKPAVAKILEWFPGVMAWPVLWYFLARAIFEFPGASFQNIALIVAAGVFIILATVPTLIRNILPENDLRKELLFMLSMLLIMLSAIAPVQGTPIFSTTQNPQLLSLLTFVTFASLLFGGGILLNKIKTRRHTFGDKRLTIRQKAISERKAA